MKVVREANDLPNLDLLFCAEHSRAVCMKKSVPPRGGWFARA